MKQLALIVEDDAGMRVIYRKVLGDMGYELIEAVDGNAAIEALRQQTPDIMFLDMLMPRLNGEAVLDFIHDMAHLSAMRVVIVTSNPHIEHRLKDRQRVDFVVKPIRPAQIRELASFTHV